MGTRIDVAAVPKPIDVGPEMEALERFFRPCTWEGTIHEGGMGPGTPAMRGVGRGVVQPIQGGRWIAGDFEQDQFLEDGTFVLRWQLHWVSGWDPEHGEYRASMVDNYGHADVYRGRIDGDRLVFESMADDGAPAPLHVGCIRPQGHHLAERAGARGRCLVPHRGVPDGAGLKVTGTGTRARSTSAHIVSMASVGPAPAESSVGRVSVATDVVG